VRKTFLPRRTFLKGLYGVGLGLPLLESLGCSTSPSAAPSSSASERTGSARQAATFPKRFLAVYTPNGTYDPPTAAFTGMWATLAPLKNKINILTGLDMTVSNQPPGEPHQSGMAALTGRALNPGNFVGGDGSLAGWASGISVDQEIANHIGVATKKKSLHAGVQSDRQQGTEVRTVISYQGSDQPVANTTDPFVLFSDVFSDLGTDPTLMTRLRARRKSVLDTVDKRFQAIQKKVSKEDAAKLEQHLTSVRTVEQQLANGGGVIGGSCQMPDPGATFDVNDPANFAKIAKIHIDLLVMAFACDLTRVGTLQFSAATNNRPSPFLTYNGSPILDDEHSLSHMPDSATDAVGKLRVIRTWYLSQLLYLLQALDAVPEGGGTMLDNTVVLLFSEITKGNTHSHMDAPFILAGSGGGYFKTGQFIDYPGDVSHCRLLTSILNAMDIPSTGFGDPAFAGPELAELRA
jgi:hypothetical protein